MGTVHKVNLVRYLPHVALTTGAVLVLPVLLVTALRNAGLVPGILPLLLCGLAVSLSISLLGAAIWKTRPGSGDIVFSDLIVWGYLRRWRLDRHLSTADQLLGPGGRRRAGAGEAAGSVDGPALLERLAGALEARDPYTHGHSRRVARHAEAIAKRLGMADAEISRVRTAAAIHDVGKVKTPREVLNKAGGLSDEEFAVIKRHPVDGARMVAGLDDPQLTEIVRHHHERLDGSGYPDGLSGEEIPIGARIIAVADTFDAITSVRPYRPAMTHRKALGILRSESGTQLDPRAVEAFCAYYSGLRPIAIWTLVTGIPQRLAPGLFDSLGAGVASASKTVAAATTAAVIATAAANGVDISQSGTVGAERPSNDILAALQSPAPRTGGRDAAHGPRRSGDPRADGASESSEPAEPSSPQATGRRSDATPPAPVRPDERGADAEGPFTGTGVRPSDVSDTPRRDDPATESGSVSDGESTDRGEGSPAREPSPGKQNGNPGEHPGGGPPPTAGSPPDVPGAGADPPRTVPPGRPDGGPVRP